MLEAAERQAIAALWTEKLSQDERGLPKAERHRNLEPASAEVVCALAAGCGARRLLEIGGSSGISTIALAVAARQTNGRLVSIEIEPARQEQSRRRLAELGLAAHVEFVLGDAGDVLERYDDLEFVLIDCEKEDYERFLGMLRLAPGAVVAADNIVSHGLGSYVRAVRAYPGVDSLTLPVGKGLEVSRFVAGSAPRREQGFAPAAVKPTVAIAEVEKIDVRIGTIVAVAEVPKSAKLLRLRVDLGDHTRTILAGMKQERADPQEIVGRQALFVVNLEPKRMAGEVSEGMVFDIGFADGVNPVLAVPERPVPNGTRAG